MTINHDNIIPFSKYILYEFQKRKKYINNLRLQRVLYQIFKEIGANPCVVYEKKAWGPCYEKVYYHYCGYGAMHISFGDWEAPTEKEYKSFTLSLRDLEVISKVLNEEIPKDDLTAIIDFNKKFGF